MRVYLLLAPLLLLCLRVGASLPHNIVFYNVENLFDTYDDPHTRDNDFLPTGKYRWSNLRYQNKLSNIAKVLGDIKQPSGELPTIIALCEVESREVVEDLAAQTPLEAARYQVVHYDSHDLRGIDCALLYSPDRFHFEGCARHCVLAEGETQCRTRDILTMWGTIDRQPIFILVGHWRSRLGGVRKSEHKRIAAAKRMREVIDSVALLRPKSRFIVMGDFNDNPDDVSIVDHLRAKGEVDQMAQGDLFNPFYAHHTAKRGSQVYRDTWSMTDNIAVSRNLIDGKRRTLQLQPSCDDHSIYATIFTPPYLLESDGRYRGYPLRTFRSGAYLGGYSDHLPIYITLE